MAVQGLLLTVQRLEVGKLDDIGLTVVKFDKTLFYRAIPSQTKLIQFRDGFYHYEIEQHGRWCSERGRLAFLLDAGEWQVVFPIAREHLSRAPSITSPNASINSTWIEGNGDWAAAVMNVKMAASVLELEFQGTSFEVEAPSNTNVEPRRLCFWMLDEVLFRPMLHLISRPIEPQEGMPHKLQSDIEAAELTSAFEPPSKVHDRVSTLRPNDSEGRLPIRIIRDGVIVGSPAILGLYKDQQLFVLHETVSYGNRLSVVRESCSRSLRRATHSFARFEKVAALCGEWSDNIWHWFLEYIPKAMALEEDGFTGIYLVPCHSDVYRDSLTLLGIDESRIRAFVYDYVAARELFVTEPFTGHQLDKYPRLVSKIANVVRSSALGSSSGAKRIYVARRGKRRVLNEADVLVALNQYGFRQVYLEDHTMAEQVTMALNAECIAGPHGAGMTFAMFIAPGGSMLEFFAPTYVNPCMTAICSVLNIAYFMITSRNYIDRPYPHGLDIEVDIPMLRLTLQTALGKPDASVV